MYVFHNINSCFCFSKIVDYVLTVKPFSSYTHGLNCTNFSIIISLFNLLSYHHCQLLKNKLLEIKRREQGVHKLEIEARRKRGEKRTRRNKIKR